MILRPKDSAKSKEAIRTAFRDDYRELLNFDDDSIPFRERIFKLEKKLLELPQVDVPIKHHFCDGIYTRTMYAPRGILIVGRLYKCEQINIISSGDVSIRSEFGGGRVKGTHIFSAQAGSKRAIYCHTDAVWTTVLPYKGGSIEDVEKEIYAESYEELDCKIVEA